MPPQVNATLTRIAGAGVSDDWDRPGDAGGEKWTGTIRGYLREKVDRVVDDGAVNVFVRRTLWVDTAELDGTGLDTDDVLTIDPDEGEPFTSPARTVAGSRLAGVRSDLQTTRIDLEDA